MNYIFLQNLMNYFFTDITINDFANNSISTSKCPKKACINNITSEGKLLDVLFYFFRK